jgi:ATP-dependent DNA helicase RecG
LIAQTLYRRGIIESWGRGTLKMIDLMGLAGLEPPEFEDRHGEVAVRFRPTRYVPPMSVARDLTELQRQILGVLHRLGPSSLQQISEAFNGAIPRRTLQDNLQFLRSLDLADLQGTQGVGARWALKGVVA